MKKIVLCLLAVLMLVGCSAPREDSVLNHIFGDKNAPEAEAQPTPEAAPEAEAEPEAAEPEATAEPTPEPTPEPEQDWSSIMVLLERKYNGSEEYAVIRAYSDGSRLWEKTTDTYPATELDATGEVGSHKGSYYYVEGGALVALDKATGEEKWRNDEFGGSVSGALIEDDRIYLCGYYGPDFFVADHEGSTLNKTDVLDDDYWWAYKITREGDKVAVHMEMGPEGEGGAVLVDPADFTVADALGMNALQRMICGEAFDAYARRIREIREETPVSDTIYYLLYIDDDEIPELFIEHNMTLAGAAVLTWAPETGLNERVIHAFSFCYIPNSGLFLDSSGRMGRSHDIVYHVNDGMINNVISGQYIQDMDDMDKYTYYINDAECTEAEYKQLIGGAYDMEESVSPDGYYTYEEILEVLEG